MGVFEFLLALVILSWGMPACPSGGEEEVEGVEEEEEKSTAAATAMIG